MHTDLGLAVSGGRMATAVSIAALFLGWLLIFPLGSFLIDPFLLIALGCLIVYVSVRVVSTPGVRRALVLLLCVVTLVIFYVCSVSLYLELPWIGWMWRLCGAESGRDWMLNSGVLNLEYVDTQVHVHLIAGALFTLYPLWVYLGVRVGRRCWDRAKTVTQRRKNE